MTQSQVTIQEVSKTKDTQDMLVLTDVDHKPAVNTLYKHKFNLQNTRTLLYSTYKKRLIDEKDYKMFVNRLNLYIGETNQKGSKYDVNYIVTLIDVLK